MVAAAPSIRPLYDTRAVEATLADLAEKMELMYERVGVKDALQALGIGEDGVGDILRHGGAWDEPKPTAAPQISAQRFEGGARASQEDVARFPLELQPYLSLQHHDGSASHLPWMQELPDPSSGSMWGLPVEIDAKTAAELRVVNGDMVRLESAYGSIEAPAYIHPGALPGVVNMGVGDGHTHYGRSVAGRGANPVSILAPAFEESTGALIMGGTRVRLVRIGGREGWIQFAAPDREERDDHR
jgi:anaerobic selenocysteine-containing dehydrogenase